MGICGEDDFGYHSLKRVDYVLEKKWSNQIEKNRYALDMECPFVRC